jgi:hypothetical protein
VVDVRKPRNLYHIVHDWILFNNKRIPSFWIKLIYEEKHSTLIESKILPVIKVCVWILIRNPKSYSLEKSYKRQAFGQAMV